MRSVFKKFYVNNGFIAPVSFCTIWKIGILAQRGIAEAHERWQPWIDWLNQQFDEHNQFSLVTPRDLNDLETEQAQGVDFIFKQPIPIFLFK